MTADRNGGSCLPWLGRCCRQSNFPYLEVFQQNLERSPSRNCGSPDRILSGGLSGARSAHGKRQIRVRLDIGAVSDTTFSVRLDTIDSGRATGRATRHALDGGSHSLSGGLRSHCSALTLPPYAADANIFIGAPSRCANGANLACVIDEAKIISGCLVNGPNLMGTWTVSPPRRTTTGKRHLR